MPHDHHTELLEQLSFPAFAVKDGIIFFANAAAIERHIHAGKAIDDILESKTEAYEDMPQGRLCLQLNIQGTTYEASVIRASEYDIFYLESEAAIPELRSLVVASQSLRSSLAEAMLYADKLEGDDSAKLRHSLYKLHRAISNMSDAATYEKVRPTTLATCHISSLFHEILEKAATQLEKAGITLEYHCPNTAIFTPVDTEKLERGVLNMISNAAKFNDGSTPIRAELHCTMERFLFSVYSHSNNSGQQIYSNLFSAYRREITIPTAQQGIGLGMTIARRAAHVHGGTLMFDQPEPGVVRLTMAIPISSHGTLTLHSPGGYQLDYAGGYDHVLLELSDVLPDELYL